jgi:hypothetical protein
MTKPAVKERMEGQLGELLHRFSRNAKIGDAIEKLSSGFIKQMAPPVGGHFVELDRIGEIDLDTVVTKCRGMFCRVREGAERVAIQFPGNLIHGPSIIGEALHYIAENSEFPVRALPGLKDPSKLVLVRRLIGEGLLETVR